LGIGRHRRFLNCSTPGIARTVGDPAPDDDRWISAEAWADAIGSLDPAMAADALADVLTEGALDPAVARAVAAAGDLLARRYHDEADGERGPDG